MILYIIIFYLAKDPKLGIEINPISSVIFLSAIPFLLFMISHLYNQLNMITKGLTTKQIKSIEDYQAQSKSIYLTEVNCHQRMSCLIEFFKRDIPTSLVFKELELNQ